MTVQPGWRWSECIKPVVGNDTCQARHVGAVVSGRLAVKHNDGTQVELSAGDAYVIEPGHDAWVEGAESCVRPTVRIEDGGDLRHLIGYAPDRSPRGSGGALNGGECQAESFLRIHFRWIMMGLGTFGRSRRI